MKHAVIVAHPNPESLTCSVARTYAKTVRELGGEAVVRDLYRMRFDPCLRESEVVAAGLPRYGDDVVTERGLLADVDVFAFVYPLWFNAPPAILKGYVDRVFSLGFGFAPGAGGTEPLLAGRRLISFTSSGAPEAWVTDTGALDALRTLFDAHLAGVTGLSVIDHIHNGGIVPGITQEAVDDVLENVRATVRGYFEAAREPV